VDILPAPVSYRLSPNKDTSSRGNTAKRFLGTATILVVEDDVHLMEGIREILELDDYNVLTASSGVEGLEVLRNAPRQPDIIVSDIMMPKMDGYQFFEAVRSEPAWLTIPFIFLTAKGEKSDIRLGKSMGVDDYLTKPFSAEDLLVAVSAKLTRTEQLQSALSRQVSDMKRRILTILNHEFRTPLTYVVAYADMLNRDAAEMTLMELREFLKGINNGADRLRRLVENFIFLVEIETGEVEVTYSWRKRQLDNYERLLETALKRQQSLTEGRKQEVYIQVDPNLPPCIGDEEYLCAALARLLDNASKFSEVGASIQIGARLDPEGRPTLFVTDHGRGISAENVQDIFETFYQVNRQKFEDQGSGSGLAIVRGIAQVHGAEISVESVEGQGSTFSLHLPPIS
jgi:signal transduction histidine kinase